MNGHLLDYFDETVKKNKEKVAVRHNNQEIRFDELRTNAIKLGEYLHSSLECLNNTPIAVLLPKEIDSIVADLGVIYSANFFMNLDVKMPKERIGNILELIRPATIITKSKYSDILNDFDINVLFIDELDYDSIQIDDIEVRKYRESLIDTDPFCIINTSGSTGTPKGVVLNYRSFFDFMNVSKEIFGFNGSEIIGSLSPVVFDIFDFEICMLMMYGSQIVLLDAVLAAFPARLLETLDNNHISFIFWVPSIMVNIANMGLLEKFELSDLKLVWFAGEVFPTKQFLQWYDSYPDVLFANLYGPIEITLDCTYYIVNERPDETEQIPIGVPYHNTDVLILNDNHKCGINEEGELCVRGTSLAMGYYNNMEKTAVAFVQNPLNESYPELIYKTGDMAYMREDGNIMFKGRKDSLIKHMGYRVELGEIEHVIENDLKIVKYCCAVYKSDKKEIVLYYESEKELSDKEFREAISKVFPSYMIPSKYIKLKELPRNTNGKIDRLLLKNIANKGEENERTNTIYAE